MAEVMTERCKRIRERLVNTDPIICPERAVLWTESYRKTEQEPPVIRAALALKETLSKMTIHIYEDELLVGNQGSALRAAPLHPQINLWFLNELDTFEKRQGSRFLISESAKEQIRSVEEYWRGKTVYERTMALLPQDAIDSMESKMFTCSYTLAKGTGHFLLNFEKVLKTGFEGIQKECEAYLEKMDYAVPEDFEKISVYRAVIIVCEAVKIFAERYAALAEEQAQAQSDPVRREELLRIASNCRRVPYYPPRDFYEAVQCTWFQQLIAQIESDGTGLSVGRLDFFLWPFYQKDRENGTLSREFAEELMDSFWLKCGEIIEVWNEDDSRYFGGHPISQTITLGGTDENGEDSVNELTYICLDTTKRVKLPQPSVCVRIHKNSDFAFLKKCAEVIREGLGMPAMYNDEIAIPSLMNRGVSMEDARRNWGVAGCVEMGLQGQMCHFANSGYFNLVKCLEITMDGGFDKVTGKQVGPQTKRAEDMESYEEFVDAFKQQFHTAMHHMVQIGNVVNTMHAKWVTLPYITSFTEDCIGRGKEVHDGGAKYNHDGPQGVGLADVADSFCAVKKLVFEEKAFTMRQLVEALQHDFQGYEDIRVQLLKDAPKYGNNDPYVDEIARKILTYFCDEVGQYRNLRGGVFVPGQYSNSANVPFGEDCGATPNGRHAHTPIAEACSPSHGSEKNGPTQAALSVAHLDHVLVTNGTQYNQKYHPNALKGEKGIASLAALIKTFFEAGGFHIQFNVVSAETLRKAQKEPEKYRDLVVRVAGYTAFFVDLNKAIQDDIIDRTEMSF
ncbi:MAG TPA: glycyl radical protein [Candidatus Blautia gallistercoris]|uniref:Glycyl radical protein n=1 Tax=Candidatus Blautia gallistercoris TaxID=2838490 RepID=A0A9D2B3B7_9FIRM|nr:glycyl radical protein [Candidatus Blautia gallistercoris]